MCGIPGQECSLLQVWLDWFPSKQLQGNQMHKCWHASQVLMALLYLAYFINLKELADLKHTAFLLGMECVCS